MGLFTKQDKAEKPPKAEKPSKAEKAAKKAEKAGKEEGKKEGSKIMNCLFPPPLPLDEQGRPTKPGAGASTSAPSSPKATTPKAGAAPAPKPGTAPATRGVASPTPAPKPAAPAPVVPKPAVAPAQVAPKPAVPGAPVAPAAGAPKPVAVPGAPGLSVSSPKAPALATAGSASAAIPAAGGPLPTSITTTTTTTTLTKAATVKKVEADKTITDKRFAPANSRLAGVRKDVESASKVQTAGHGATAASAASLREQLVKAAAQLSALQEEEAASAASLREHLANAQKQVLSLQEELDALKNQSYAYQEDIATLETQLSQEKTDHAFTVDRKADLQKSHDAVSANLEAHKAKLADTTAKLAAAQAEVEALKKTLDDKHKEISTSRETINVGSANLAQEKQRATELAAAIRKLEADLAAEKKAHADAKLKLEGDVAGEKKAHADTKTKLEGEIAATKTKAAADLAAAVAAEKKVAADAKAKLEGEMATAVAGEKKAHADTKAKLEADLAALKAKLEGELAAEKKAHAETKAKLEADLAAEKKAAAELKAKLEGDLATTNGKLTAETAALAKANKDLADAKAEVAKLQAALTAKTTEAADLTTQLSAAKAKLAATEAELATTKAALEDTKAKLAAKEAELAELSKKYAAQADLLKTTTASLEKTTADKTALQAKYDAEVKAHSEVTKPALAASQAKATELAASVEAKNKEIADLKAQLAALQAANDKLKADLEAQKAATAKAQAEAAAALKAAADAKAAAAAAKKKLAENEEAMSEMRGALNAASRSVTAGQRYKINVQTGDKLGAGTDADVSVILIGELGNSQEIDLDNPVNNYERNKMDMFTVALGRTTFGSINEIDIGFATKQSLIGATIGFFMRDWYLSYVEVLDCATNEKKLFVVDQWINKDQRRVRVKAWALGDQNIYRLLVRTADTKGAGTDAKVMMRMYGKKDGKTVDSGAHKLESSDQRTFERAATDKFFIQCPDLCDLSRIVIATDNGGLFPAWHLAEIEVMDVARDTTVVFPANVWFDGKKDPMSLQHTLLPAAANGALTDYKINVYTSDLRSAGTSAHISVQLFGDKDYSHKIKVKSAGKNFERGQRDSFRTSTINVGNLTHVLVRKDEAGFSSDWHLHAVEIFNNALGKRYVCYCKEWLKGTVERKLEVAKVEDVTTDATPSGAASPGTLSPRK